MVHVSTPEALLLNTCDGFVHLRSHREGAQGTRARAPLGTPIPGVC